MPGFLRLEDVRHGPVARSTPALTCSPSPVPVHLRRALKMPHYACASGRGRYRPFGSYFPYLVPVAGRIERNCRAAVAKRRSRLVRDRQPELLPRPSASSPVQSRSTPRWRRTTAACGNAPVSGPSRRERAHRLALRERADGRGGLRDGVLRGERRRGRELPLGRDAAAQLPEREAVAQLRVDVGAARARGEDAQLAGGARRRRKAEAETMRRQVRRDLRVEDVLGGHRLRRVGELRLSTRCSCRDGVGRAARPEERPAEMELRERAPRVRRDEPLQRVEAAVRPARRRRRRSARRREWYRAKIASGRRRALPCRRSVSPRAERRRLGVAADAEVEASAAAALPRLRHRAAAAVVVSPRVWSQVTATVPATASAAASRDDRRAHAPGRSSARQPSPRARTAIFPKVMPTYRELLAAGAGRDRRGRRRARARAPRRRPSRRSSSTCASPTSGPRATSPAPSTCRAATSSRASSAPRPTGRRPIVVYCAGGQPLGVRGEDARGARLRERRLARRRLHRLEAQRLPDAAARARSTRRSARATAATCSSPRSARRAS